MRPRLSRAFRTIGVFTLGVLLASAPRTSRAAADLSPLLAPDGLARGFAPQSVRPDLGVLARTLAGPTAPQGEDAHLLSRQPQQPADLGVNPGFAFESDTANRQLGQHAVTAGDVNGDGISDMVAIGQVGGSRTAVYLYLGSASGPVLAPGYPNESLTPAQTGFAPIGDVNGDGYDDVAFSWFNSGIVRVVYGYAGGLDFSHFTILNLAINSIGQIAPAGDVNGDGYGEMIVGEPNAEGGSPCGSSPFSGVAVVFYGSASGVSNASNWIVTGCYATGTGATLGASVCGAGDVNGDGYDDIALGAPGANHPVGSPGNTYGKVYVIYGSSSGLPLLPGYANLGAVTYGSVIIGHALNASFGNSVAPAGDLNGDGYADLAIGSPTEDTYGTDSGKAFVFRGTSSGIDSSYANLLWWESSGVANAQMGIFVRPAGDINGDGKPDLLVGETNRVDVAQSFLGTYNIAQTLPYAVSSTEVNTAGDVNADGMSDVVVGDAFYANGQSAEGRVLVHYGAGSPPAASAAWSASQYVIDNPNLGWSVASAGDVNGDGFEDVIVGAPTWYDWSQSGQSNNGLVMLFYGHATGPSTLYDWANWGASGDQLGICVAGGDVNGDGYSDLIVGSHTAAGGVGQVRIWYGSSSGPTGGLTLTGYSAGSQFGASVACAGDVNGDGYPDVVVGAPYGVDPTSPLSGEGRAYVFRGGAGGLVTTPIWSASGGQANAHFGSCVAAGGDVNGDSYGDVLIGGPDFDNVGKFSINYTDAGRVYVEFGGAGGIASEQTYRAFANSWRLGGAVAGAGDVNGDGYSDILYGATGATNTFTNEGMAGVLQGAAGGIGSLLWTQYGGEAYGGFGSSVSSAGDADGDGLSDVLVGAVFQDMGGPQDQGRAYLYRGPLPAGAAPFWTAGGGSMFANLGHSLANVGDVNGDGWTDYVFGLPGYSDTFNRQGICRIYLGARGSGSFQNALAYHLTSPVHFVQPGCLADPGQVVLASTIRSAAGRGKVRLQYAIRGPNGLSAPPKTGLTAFTATNAPNTYGSVGAILFGTTGLVNGVPYAWTLRSLARNVWYPTGPWRQPARSGRLEADFRVPGTWLSVPGERPQAELLLADVRPNPMLASAAISFSLSKPGAVTLDVLDVQGRRVRSLACGAMPAGPHQVAWDGRTDAGSASNAGVYFVRLEAEGRTLNRKLVRVR